MNWTRHHVPEGTFTLALEPDDDEAAAEHAAFADHCQPLLLRVADDDCSSDWRITMHSSPAGRFFAVLLAPVGGLDAGARHPQPA